MGPVCGCAIAWCVQPHIVVMAFLGCKSPKRCTRRVRLVRPGSPRDVAVHTTWDFTDMCRIIYLRLRRAVGGGTVEAVPMVPRHCLGGGWGRGFVGFAVRAVQGLSGGQCCIVAVWMICTSWGRRGGVQDMAGRWSRHRGVTRMPNEDGAEGGKDLAHKGRMRCSCFFLSVDGG